MYLSTKLFLFLSLSLLTNAVNFAAEPFLKKADLFMVGQGASKIVEFYSTVIGNDVSVR